VPTFRASNFYSLPSRLVWAARSLPCFYHQLHTYEVQTTTPLAILLASHLYNFIRMKFAPRRAPSRASSLTPLARLLAS